MYRDTNTGEIWMQGEIEEGFEMFRCEMTKQYASASEYIEEMVRTGNLEKID